MHKVQQAGMRIAKVKRDTMNYVYTHKSYSIAYNNDRVIEVNLTAEHPIALKPGAKLDFTYSVAWQPTTKSFHNRFRRYLDHSFFEHQIHWFSIFNSFMMVIFLCGLVALILIRTLRNDYAKYTRDEDDLDGVQGVVDESGWKQVHVYTSRYNVSLYVQAHNCNITTYAQVHSDVFRKPQHLMLFSALIGTGYQLIVLAATGTQF